MHVLHLASWFPNSTGEQDGDFIQRHLKAIARFLPVYLIHVVKDEQIKTRVSRSKTQEGNLNETIVYYKPIRTGLPPLDKFISTITYKKVFKDAIRAHFQEHGKPQLVHVHVAMRAGLLALWMRNKFKIPFIVSEHWSGYYKTDPDNYFTRNLWFRLSTKKIIANASWLITVSNNLFEQLAPLFTVRNHSVIYNVVDTDSFFHKPSANSRFTFIHVSNMHPIKNVAGILTVLGRLNNIRDDWKLIMVGEINPSYQRLAIALGIADHVEWRGVLPHDHVPDEIRKADAMIIFSNLETLSCVVCESLCCGVPVIATNVGGLPEIVTETNGKLCEPGVEAELLEHIIYVMDKPGTYEPKRISAEASRQFNASLIGSQFLSVYEQVLNNVSKL